MSSIPEQQGTHNGGSSNELPDEVIIGFLRLLESVRLQDMPCSEVFARLDEYVEHELLDHQAAMLMPLLREHFDMCPDCCDQYEALLDVLEQSQSSGDEVPPVVRGNP